MIKFFRKIRQQLLTENKLSKYLIYAIGEIALVVIGILIALQVNNKNELKKARIVEGEYLIGLKEEFEYNLNHIRNKEKLNDSMSNHFYGPFKSGSPKLISSAYETLKSSGLDIIKSDELREGIINLYEVLYAEYIVNIEQTLNNWETQMIAPYYSQNFSVVNDKILTPNNYELLFSDQKFIN